MTRLLIPSFSISFNAFRTSDSFSIVVFSSVTTIFFSLQALTTMERRCWESSMGKQSLLTAMIPVLTWGMLFMTMLLVSFFLFLSVGCIPAVLALIMPVYQRL